MAGKAVNMRCDAVRRNLEEGCGSAGVEAHVSRCAACAQYAADWERIRQGLVNLGAEAAPEASTGFAARVVHRIEYAAREAPAQIVTDAGRKVAYATMLLALMMILGLVVPPAGPVRSSGMIESVLSQPEIAALAGAQEINEQSLGVDSNDIPANVGAAPGVQGDQGTR